MKLFVWLRIHHASDNYHPEGGLVVCAESLARAHEIADTAKYGSEKWGLMPNGLHGYTGEIELKDAGTALREEEEPNLVFDLAGDHDEGAWSFPDAGCC